MEVPDVVVIDYGMGNLLSVQRGLEHCGAKVHASADPEIILTARKTVLPGVGAFADGMAELQNRGLDVVVKKLAAKRVPLLGICLGMQMLLDESEEFGRTQGLGLISGRVIPIPTMVSNGDTQKIPHIGWSGLNLPSSRESWSGTLLRDIESGDAVYFVHSFMAVPSNPEECVAESNYGGVSVVAAIQHENVYGCQFHPEKSGEVGLNILRNFLAL